MMSSLLLDSPTSSSCSKHLFSAASLEMTGAYQFDSSTAATCVGSFPQWKTQPEDVALVVAPVSQFCRVVDFAPSCCELSASGDAKMLIVLSSDALSNHAAPPFYVSLPLWFVCLLLCCAHDQVCFASVAHQWSGPMRIQAELITPTVLRCRTPSQTAAIAAGVACNSR